MYLTAVEIWNGKYRPYSIVVQYEGSSVVVHDSKCVALHGLSTVIVQSDGTLGVTSKYIASAKIIDGLN